MNEPDTDAMSRHLKRLVSVALSLDEDAIESVVHAIPCDDGSYICHLHVMLQGREPTEREEKAILYTVQRFGFPGIRVTSLKIPAEA